MYIFKAKKYYYYYDYIDIDIYIYIYIYESYILSVLPATGRVLFHTKLRSVNRRIYNYTKTKIKLQTN